MPPEPLKLRITISTMNDIVLDYWDVTETEAADTYFNTRIAACFQAERRIQNEEPRG